MDAPEAGAAAAPGQELICFDQSAGAVEAVGLAVQWIGVVVVADDALSVGGVDGLSLIHI